MGVSQQEGLAGLELGDDGAGRAVPGEGGEHGPDRVSHPDVGVEHDLVGRVVDQPDRQGHLQFTAAGLGQLPAAQPGADEVQFGLADGVLRAEQLELAW